MLWVFLASYFLKKQTKIPTPPKPPFFMLKANKDNSKTTPHHLSN
jgi:hypothetical protein